jgi:hypothetical protein
VDKELCNYPSEVEKYKIIVGRNDEELIKLAENALKIGLTISVYDSKIFNDHLGENGCWVEITSINPNEKFKFEKLFTLFKLCEK